MTLNVQDISIENLEAAQWISTHAINICRKNQLNTLSDIIAFYRSQRTFKNLENCGEKIEKELSDICYLFQNQPIDIIVHKIHENTTIKMLISQFSPSKLELATSQVEYLISKLSVRARNGLFSVFGGNPEITKLVEKIYSNSFSFSAIRNIGEKSQNELNNFKESLSVVLNELKSKEDDDLNEKVLAPTSTEKVNKTIVDVVNEFDPFKRAILNHHIEFLISNLGARAKNGIIDFFGSKISCKEIIEKIYSNTFSFQNIRKIGTKTVSELTNFRDDISAFIETLHFIEAAQLSLAYARLMVKKTFSQLPADFDEQFEKTFDTSGKIRLFKLISFLIEKGQLFDHREKTLFYCLYTENYVPNINQIAKTLDLSKERLRQIKVLVEEEIQDYFQFILNFNVQDIIDYDINSADSFKVIDGELVENINTEENVKFNARFYSVVFGLLLHHSHSVLGENKIIPSKRKFSNAKRYRNCYLIGKQIFNVFNFEMLVDEVSMRLSERITESYSLHFEGYLLQFLKPNCNQYLSTIKLISETILYHEFELVVGNDGYILFERNIRKPMLDYVVEVLEELGEMTKVEDISNAINDKYPELGTSEQTIRSTMQREKNLFIYIGRTSTYGLKKWETENSSLKGGTIRDIAEEYLEKHNCPQHIYDIVGYVIKYRNTSSTSIFRNIQAEDRNRFVFFEGGFIGLKNKIYAPKDIIFKKVSGTNFRLSVLKRFDGWRYEKVVSYYVNTYDYKRVQVINLLETKIQTGEITLNKDNTIKIP